MVIINRKDNKKMATIKGMMKTYVIDTTSFPRMKEIKEERKKEKIE